MSETFAERVRLYGKPQPGKTYRCQVKSSNTGTVREELLKCVKEDDVLWRTADDGSELDEWNWNVESWLEV